MLSAESASLPRPLTLPTFVHARSLSLKQTLKSHNGWHKTKEILFLHSSEGKNPQIKMLAGVVHSRGCEAESVPSLCHSF